MEEAAQILEVETLIPLLLQDTDPIDGSRLKRVILLGDHYQLPPVVKHSAYKQFSHFDQSLFSRFIRLGVPHVLLDKQGRSRPEIADLYSWRYSSSARSLGNLPIVETTNEYISCNAGFLHNLQLIDVQDFKGKGEFAPTPYFYQNLGEAEYVVAVYQYMRLLGYPKSKITILTTYNGQKQLIRDVVNQRCQHPFFGKPADINTVDKYQGQQNDFILLSLVRTETVGHLRDIRRLIVALSRARLGLYVFCRKSIFEDCLDLKVAISKLIGSRPSQLQLVVDEAFPTSRTSSTLAKEVKSVVDVTAMGVLVYQMVQRKEQSMYM